MNAAILKFDNDRNSLHVEHSHNSENLKMAANQLFRFLEEFKDTLNSSREEAVRTLVTIVLTLLSYHALFGNWNMRKRRRLAEELDVAKAQLAYLKVKLQGPSQAENDGEKKKDIRIFMEGAFDLMHFGHMNAFRLGRSLGTHLVVGVNSDESITECKAAPLMNNDERLTMVRSCKFVDEVVPNTPYIMNKEYIDYIFQTYKVDYIIHGDDPCIVDGK